MSSPKLFSISISALLAFFQLNTTLAQNALDFDGANDYVQTSFNGVLGTAERTFEAWVKISSSASGNSCILDYGTNAVGSRNTFSVGGSNSLIFISGGVNANISSPSSVIPAETWTHVAFVLNNGTGYLYVNGTQVGIGSLSTVNTPSGNTNMRIGQRVPGGSIPFEGSIDEVRVWNVARTAAEISNNMGTEYCALDSNLVAYHKFNHGAAGGTNTSSTNSYDASGNGNNGTLNNFGLTGSASNWVTGYGMVTSTLSDSVSVTGCDGSYTSPSGNHVWTSSGIYQDTLSSVMACDSILTIDLSFGSSNAASIVETACSTYTSPSGLYTWTESGVYMDTLQNASGCDSVLTIDLSINNTSSEYNVEACNAYTLPSGSNTYTLSGSYFDTIPNAAGCDSAMLIHVTILQNSFASIDAQGCGSYTSPSGQLWTLGGTYVDSIPSANGCDSIITIELTIVNVNSGISKNGTVLSADAFNADYQWIDCENGNLISGEVNKDYTPSQSGSYAVVVTEDGCSDTSDCIEVEIVGIRAVADQGSTLFPNPTLGIVSLQLQAGMSDVRVEVLNSAGQRVQTRSSETGDQIRIDLGSEPGVYMILVVSSSGSETFRVLNLE